MPKNKTGLKSCSALLAILLISARSTPAKEFLTQQEIDKIQDAQEIDKRVKIYMEAAALRLKTAEERLGGKESNPGDPLEFFAVEDLIDGYYRILKSVMSNLDEAANRPTTDRKTLYKALETLKNGTETGEKNLVILKKIAEEKQKEELWNLVNSALDIARGAHEGADTALSHEPQPEKSKTKK